MADLDVMDDGCTEFDDELSKKIGLRLTLHEIAERLGISVEAARALAAAGLRGLQAEA